MRALTGVDTDRLPEEKARGITIELGFAPLDLGDGLRLSVVDVPGHEGLVRTMVAGATGIDLVLLVVAADEGVMPQTREHLAICELLGLAHGVVALTKSDLAAPELAALAAEEVVSLLAEGPLAGAPVVPVSAQTGAGLGELRDALRKAAERAAPRTPRSGPPRLAIDRAFAARGFGTIVTGTLLGSPLAVGDAVEIFPAGLRARVRGVQSHSETREQGEPGSRCALNLQGVELAQVARGQIVSTPGALAPARALDVSLAWLATAPRAGGPVSVELLAATCERRAHLAPIGAEELAPGERGFARIHIDGEPLPVLPGDRFIVRGFARSEAAGATLGGGVVLDVAPPHRRRSDPQLLHELEALARREPVTDVAVRISRAALAGMPRERLLAETGLSGDALDAALAELAAAGRVTRAGSALWLDARSLGAIEQRTLAALAAWHAAEPIRPGIPARTLRGRLPENVAPEAFELALARLAERGEVAILGDLVRAGVLRGPPLRRRSRGLRPDRRRGARRGPRAAGRPRVERAAGPSDGEAPGSARASRAGGRAGARARRAVVRPRRHRRPARARARVPARARPPRDARLQGADRHLAPHRRSADGALRRAARHRPPRRGPHPARRRAALIRTARDRGQPPISGTDRLRRIFRANRFAISVWRGTASTTPVAGLHQRECDAPSRLRKQPCRLRCRSRAPRFTR